MLAKWPHAFCSDHPARRLCKRRAQQPAAHTAGQCALPALQGNVKGALNGKASANARGKVDAILDSMAMHGVDGTRVKVGGVLLCSTGAELLHAPVLPVPCCSAYVPWTGKEGARRSCGSSTAVPGCFPTDSLQVLLAPSMDALRKPDPGMWHFMANRLYSGVNIGAHLLAGSVHGGLQNQESQLGLPCTGSAGPGCSVAWQTWEPPAGLHIPSCALHCRLCPPLSNPSLQTRASHSMWGTATETAGLPLPWACAASAPPRSSRVRSLLLG